MHDKKHHSREGTHCDDMSSDVCHVFSTLSAGDV